MVVVSLNGAYRGVLGDKGVLDLVEVNPAVGRKVVGAGLAHVSVTRTVDKEERHRSDNAGDTGKGTYLFEGLDKHVGLAHAADAGSFFDENLRGGVVVAAAEVGLHGGFDGVISACVALEVAFDVAVGQDNAVVGRLVNDEHNRVGAIGVRSVIAVVVRLHTAGADAVVGGVDDELPACFFACRVEPLLQIALLCSGEKLRAVIERAGCGGRHHDGSKQQQNGKGQRRESEGKFFHHMNSIPPNTPRTKISTAMAAETPASLPTATGRLPYALPV